MASNPCLARKPVMPRLHQRLKVIRSQPSTRNLRCSSRMSHGNNRLWASSPQPQYYAQQPVEPVYTQPVAPQPEPVYQPEPVLQPVYQQDPTSQQNTAFQQPGYQPEPVQQPVYQQDPTFQQSTTFQLVVEQPTVVEPEPVVEEVKPTRPPLYYFEEVERNVRVSVSNWPHGISRFQNLLRRQRVKPSTPSMPTTASIPPVESVAAVAPLAAGVKSAALGVSAAAAAPVFSLAGSGTPRPQVERGHWPAVAASESCARAYSS